MCQPRTRQSCGFSAFWASLAAHGGYLGGCGKQTGGGAERIGADARHLPGLLAAGARGHRRRRDDRRRALRMAAALEVLPVCRRSGDEQDGPGALLAVRRFGVHRRPAAESANAGHRCGVGRRTAPQGHRPEYTPASWRRALYAPRVPPFRPLAERFWEKVDRRGPDECWPWTGSRNKAGYGSLKPGAPSRTSVMAHRVAYELAFGPIPEGLTIDHVRARGCTRTDCCNPAHLEAVTYAENQRRGRNTKLTAQDVATIRAEVADGAPQKNLAARFGVHQSTVSKIVNGRKWGSCVR